MGGRLRFLKAFLKRPGVIGAVTPSSRELAHEVVNWIDWARVEACVEFGPGTGVFTEQILSRLKPGARFFAIELEAELVETLRARFPGVTVIQDTVSNVRILCEQQGVGPLDAIVSGLPWASFPASQQRAFMAAATSALKPGGQFVTFAYLQGLMLPAGLRFRRLLREYFSELTTSRTIWLNLPPAFVYRCRY